MYLLEKFSHYRKECLMLQMYRCQHEVIITENLINIYMDWSMNEWKEIY